MKCLTKTKVSRDKLIENNGVAIATDSSDKSGRVLIQIRTEAASLSTHRRSVQHAPAAVSAAGCR